MGKKNNKIVRLLLLWGDFKTSMEVVCFLITVPPAAIWGWRIAIQITENIYETLLTVECAA